MREGPPLTRVSRAACRLVVVEWWRKVSPGREAAGGPLYCAAGPCWVEEETGSTRSCFCFSVPGCNFSFSFSSISAIEGPGLPEFQGL